MVQMLASHAAGFRLGRIVGLLLIPIFWLAYLLASATLIQLADSRATGQGLTLLDRSFNLMLEAAIDHKVSAKLAQSFKDEGAPLAVSLGVTKEFGQVQHLLGVAEPDTQQIMQKSQELMSAIGSGSAANGDVDAESRELILGASTFMPQALLAFARIKQLSTDISASPDTETQKFPEIVSQAAVLQFNARQLDMLVVRARSRSSQTSAYSELLKLTSRLNFDSGYFKVLLFDRGTENNLKMGQVASAVDEAGAKWSGTLAKGWEDLQMRLFNLNDARRTSLINGAVRSFGLSIAAILFSLFTSISMFRSTLRRLDTVEAAEREANVARLGAEAGAKELSQMNEDLARMNGEVNQHLKSLRDAQDQLLKKGRLEQLGQLTATIAHELRNPLGAVRTSVFLLERKTRGKELGIEGQIQRINNGIARCDNTITQLLDFSRSRQVSTHTADFDNWLEKIVAEEAQRLPASVMIQCKLGLDGLPVAFDAARLQRAVVNLISNASEAMVGYGEDGNKQAITEPTLTISTQRDGDHVLVVFADNGPGIKSEDLERIREPLFTTKNFGTGLGLPAVEQILAQHGGSLLVNSKQGAGACFTMRLPIVNVAEMAA